MAKLGQDLATLKYEVVNSQDYCVIDERGLPASLSTTRDFRSLAKGLTHIDACFTTSSYAIAVTGGGTLGKRYDIDGTTFGTEIKLDHPLDAGQIATVNYNTAFAYKPEDKIPPYFRRMIGYTTMEKLAITVAFDPQHAPSRVTWTEWQGQHEDSPIVPESQHVMQELEPVEFGSLGGYLTATRALYDVTPGTVLGFMWEL